MKSTITNGTVKACREAVRVTASAMTDMPNVVLATVPAGIRFRGGFGHPAQRGGALRAVATGVRRIANPTAKWCRPKSF